MSALNRIIDNRSDAVLGLSARWFGLAFLTAISLGVVYLWLYNAWTPENAIRWLGLATIFSASLLVMVRRHLSDNHRVGEREVLPNFGRGNQLTIFRGILIAFLAGFLFSPWPQGVLAWLPATIYLLAALFDLFDGYLARRSNHVTRLGEILDMKLDGLGVMVACLLIVQYQQVPYWYLLVGMARYLFLAGEWALRKLGRPVYELAPNPARRPLAGVQMGFIAVMLLPIFSPPGTYLVAGLFAAPFLVGFFYDWLTVSGLIKNHNYLQVDTRSHVNETISQARKWWKVAQELGKMWLPFVTRAVVVVLLILWLFIDLPWLLEFGRGQISDHLAYSGISEIWFNISLMLIGAGLVALVFGTAGRVAGIIVLVGIGIYQNFSSLGGIELALLVGATAVVYLGTGPFSLWAPEKRILMKRIGES